MRRQGSGSWQAAPRGLRRSRRRARGAPLGITRGLPEAVRQGPVKLDHRRPPCAPNASNDRVVPLEEPLLKETTAPWVPNASNDRAMRVKRVKRPRRGSQTTAARAPNAPNARNDRVVSLEEPPLKQTTASRTPNAPNDRVMRVKRIERPRRWCQATASSPLRRVLRVQWHKITRYCSATTLDYKVFHARSTKRH